MYWWKKDLIDYSIANISYITSDRVLQGFERVEQITCVQASKQNRHTTVFQLKSKALKKSIYVNLKREKLNFTPNLRIKQIERLVDSRVHKNVLRPAAKTKKLKSLKYNTSNNDNNDNDNDRKRW